jgi:hypothetical protein
MIAFAFLMLAIDQPVQTVDSETFDLSADTIALEWDCQRDRDNDKLVLSEPMGREGKEPLFTRTLAGQPPKVVVDCGPEVIVIGKRSLSLSSGFCPNEWGLEIKLVDGTEDRAKADLRLGQEWINGYECVRRTSGERA